MFPTICTIGPFSVYSYGVCLALAAIICFFLLSRDARRRGIDAGVVSDLIFWSVVGGILGARLLFVFLNWKVFMKNPLEIIMIQHGGLAWQGSLLGGFVTGSLYVRKKKLDFFKTLDLVAPYIALGQSIGRVGCFLNGCCHGREATWGIYFPVHHAYLVPTQLYALGSLLLIFLILKRAQVWVKIPGKVFVLYLVLASLQRFVIQFFRADYMPIVFGIDFFQLVCVGIIFAALVLNLIISKKDRS